ncbi:MAG TPA: hypothetical protein VHI52_06305 [Verrucomicrobiae bacterium]|nr:hypothetical protein [Verrucomicrobiae bacterium]
MKASCVAASVMLWSVAALAQGTVNFCNLNAGAGLNAPVYYAQDGVTKLSTGWTAELLAGKAANEMAICAQTGFLTGAGAGYFQGGAVSIFNVAPGEQAFVQVRVFETAYGSYAAAMMQSMLLYPSTIYALTGSSPVFTVTTGGGGIPPSVPAALTGLTSFKTDVMIAEPSACALMVLGSTALLIFRRRWSQAPAFQET